ncbi:uncharacterized protein [Mytilus edulis]|uniref:Uncharacterized protein n=1 Tax=Mytilus galloprovincialis TaxID=29158 RepID=A0A8B6H5H2_MYTGA|nr:Hypothetical predicted protein [Mytilus galloprovincialis]
MKHRFVFIVFCAGLCCLVTGVPLNSLLSRERRHFAEFKTTDYATRIALERQFSKCRLIGCGLVDIVASGKKKRNSPFVGQFSDEKRQYLISKILEKARE